ncbi:MAG: FtsW/RodA/SpoVE family cell cycle protein [Planctomycetota bacterium]|nr:FtsW/RodA/SpoVE family cell cycle protein [Planctomycetota bacterium]MDA0932778.1 FtsW/RodA/SpoVE family cell cycle protein [Planctomycetota bacterium]MDA1222752.1 FtsW/RodA/SpoVE family cell cycle protein [Planctomycetota bacterium]
MTVGKVLRHVDWWVVLLIATISAVGVLFVHSATYGSDLEALARKQVLFLCAGTVLGAVVVFVPYARFLRGAWAVYALAVLALVGLFFFGSVLNGARRWYRMPGVGFALQPSEFAKLAVVLALAAWFRFRDKAGLFEGLLVPIGITALPVGLVFLQPDFGSSLTFWPILFAVAYAAGVSGRRLLAFGASGLALLVVAWFTVLAEYQKTRVRVWLEHLGWDRAAVEGDPAVREMLLGDAYQPWQALIAIGSGGVSGHGYLQGPQSRFDFLPYRYGDYIFAVLAEEAGLLGSIGLIGLYLLLVLGLLRIAVRTRERFGRLVVVGVAAWLGAQSFLHVAVCAWMLPATGLPLPLVSQGGSVTVAAVLGLAVALGVGARPEPVLGGDGYS